LRVPTYSSSEYADFPVEIRSKNQPKQAKKFGMTRKVDIEMAIKEHGLKIFASECESYKIRRRVENAQMTHFYRNNFH
jgi:hypothetical protein